MGAEKKDEEEDVAFYLWSKGLVWPSSIATCSIPQPVMAFTGPVRESKPAPAHWDGAVRSMKPASSLRDRIYTVEEVHRTSVMTPHSGADV